MSAFETVGSIIDQSRSGAALGQYQYPLSPGAHNMILTFRKYDVQSTLSLVGGSGTSVSGSVVLPIPSNLIDTYSVRVASQELGATGALMRDVISGQGGAVAGEMRGALGGALNGDGNRMTNALSSAQGFSRFAGRNLLDSIMPGAGAAVGIAGGTATNPHVALEFEGMALKTHAFDWTMSPRNESEAEAIKNIIQYIRFNALPSFQSEGGTSTAAGRAVFEYPSLVDISFAGIDQSYFYYFKPAMITNLTFNYAPTNELAVNRGGKPSIVNMRLDMTEARIHTREDYA